MKNPKKQDDAKVRPGKATDDLGDLFKEIDSLGPSLGDEDEEVLELDEVVDEGENGLKDLPDLEEGLSDLDDLDSVLDEPEGEESLFEEEVTVELAPSGKGAERAREPLDEELFDEKLGEPQEPLEREPEPLPAEDQEGARELRDEGGLSAVVKEDTLWDETEEVEEPKPLETEVWDADAERNAVLKGTVVTEETLEAFEDVKSNAASATPMEETVDGEVEGAAGIFAKKDFAREISVPEKAAVAGAMGLVFDAMERHPLTLTEPAEEKVMEERPAMFQPIVDILEKRLQIMVQKAVQEHLPIVVRRVLQEEIERLTKMLG